MQAVHPAIRDVLHAVHRCQLGMQQVIGEVQCGRVTIRSSLGQRLQAHSFQFGRNLSVDLAQWTRLLLLDQAKGGISVVGSKESRASHQFLEYDR